MSTTTSKPTIARPSRPQQPAEEHVEKARRAVVDDEGEKQLKVLAAPKYHKGMAELKNMTTDSVPVKHLLLEAIEDLFAKYGRGEGRFKVDDVPELRRRLESLMK
ncbi:TPA: hypothetical protein NHP34_006023 [Pseudomonas aeruginosa]|nr:hypothetical protein [Pseudomonas aeruginosa]